MKTIPDNVYEKIVFCLWGMRDFCEPIEGGSAEFYLYELQYHLTKARVALEWLEAWERGFHPRCEDLAEPEDEVFR